ncbi:MAG: TIM barrel protein [Actinomycetaceae bacterium]|nr:TIM barrel protein [Actinomycetaceae bacterium]
MKYAINCSIMFTELPILQRPAAAKAAGFNAVEFWWPWAQAVPSDQEVQAFIDAIREADVELIGLNFFAGNMAGGDRGLVSWVGREEDFKANVPVAIHIAKETGCKAFNALYGLRLEGVSPEEQDALGASNLIFAAKAAEEIGAVVLVEPISGSEAYPLKTADDCQVVIEKVQAAGAKNVKMLLDLYHLAANGDNVAKACEKYSAEAGHCQIADLPGRGEPGTGQLPLADLLSLMRSSGYDSWVALEYKPTVATAESFTALPVLA